MSYLKEYNNGEPQNWATEPPQWLYNIHSRYIHLVLVFKWTKLYGKTL